MSEHEYQSNLEFEVRPDEMFMGSGKNWEFNNFEYGLTIDNKGDFAEFHFEPFGTSDKQQGKEFEATRMLLVGLDDYVKGAEQRFNEDDLEPPKKIIGLTKNKDMAEVATHAGIQYRVEKDSKGEVVFVSEVTHDAIKDIVDKNKNLIDSSRKKLKSD